jgi:hypothetical protein
MKDWGLRRGIDFNSTDAAVRADHQAVEEAETAGEGGQETRTKTRAYDFVLPFRTPGWEPKILIQCQFYAGDSGSVSHKNVDQTSKSRSSAKLILPNARFIEYVDGAGYFSSLNGDLKTLLTMPDTLTFVQLRSAPIRLRRELQQIGFLAPIDVAHAALREDARTSSVSQHLVTSGYSTAEVDRAIRTSIELGLLEEIGGRLIVRQSWRSTVRQYGLLDTAAISGRLLDARAGLAGKFLIPGYGPLFGLELDHLARSAVTLLPALAQDWSSPEVILTDIRNLCERGFAIAG